MFMVHCQVEVNWDTQQSVPLCDCAESWQSAALRLSVSQSTRACLRGYWTRHWREHSAQGNCTSHR